MRVVRCSFICLLILDWFCFCFFARRVSERVERVGDGGVLLEGRRGLLPTGWGARSGVVRRKENRRNRNQALLLGFWFVYGQAPRALLYKRAGNESTRAPPVRFLRDAYL